MPNDFENVLDPTPNEGSGATANRTPKNERIMAPVPDNQFNTKSRVELQLMEDTCGSIRAWQVMVNHVYLPGTYNADHLRDIHAHVMQDIYSEPGATRNDELLLARHAAKDKPGVVVPAPHDTRLGTQGEFIALVPADQVNARLNELSDRLFNKDNQLRGLEKPAFVKKLTDYYLEYSKVSPFAAGNKHVLDAVFTQIGVHAGYDVRPEQAPYLNEATDTILAAGIHTNRTGLLAAFTSVTIEDEGIGTKVLRSPTLAPMP